MVIQSANDLHEHLEALKEQRRSQAIDARTYYTELLKLANSLIESLIDEVDRIDNRNIRLQIPLVLLFIEDQIQKFGERS